MSPTVWKPALIAGLSLGVVASVPFLGSCLNICCCGLGALAGLVGAMLLLSETPLSPRAPYGRGALVGFLTGAIGSITFVFASTLTSLAMGLAGLRPRVGNIEGMVEDSGIPPILIESFEHFVPGGAFSIMAMLGALAFSFVAYTGSATIGAVVGVAMFHTKRPPEESFGGR